MHWKKTGCPNEVGTLLLDGGSAHAALSSRRNEEANPCSDKHGFFSCSRCTAMKICEVFEIHFISFLGGTAESHKSSNSYIKVS